MRRIVLGLAVFMLAACGVDSAKGKGEDATETAEAASTAAEEPPRNLLTLAEGAVLVSASANAAAALSLNDGNVASSWNNQVPRNVAPYTFVFELRAPTRLERVGVVGAGARPGGVAGASANMIQVEASSESATAGFVALGRWAAAEDGESAISSSLDREVRWLRFTVENNHSGTPAWTYLSEVVAYGAQTPPTDAARFNGVFDLGRGALMQLKVSGASVTGCYVDQGGRGRGALAGDISEGVARLAWRSDQPGVNGPALLVIDSRGHLNGVRYRDNSRSVWSGPPTTTATPPCPEPAPSNPIADALADSGEARIYGILFDFDQATIKSSSEPALQQLLGALQTNASMNVDIEGHTDNVGEDAYNLSLSERRAQSVVAWLTSHGIAAARLNAVGKGETEPVASNDAADGRALNRRVEVARRS